MTALLIAAGAVGYVAIGFGVALVAFRGQHLDITTGDQAAIAGGLWPIASVLIAISMVQPLWHRANRALDARAARRALPEARARGVGR